MRWIALLLLLFATLAMPSTGAAQREHTVRSGQSLSRIARRYRVRVQDLSAANGLTVRSELREGQVLKIPERGTHYVRQGQTLSHVALEHGVTVAELARVNRLRRDAPLRVGQRLLLPGHDAAEEREEAESRWGRPRNPGVVTLVRVLTHDRIRLRLLDRRGRPRRAAKRRLARLFRYRRTTQSKEPPGRLLRVLTQISDHFGGRPISVYSAFRPEGGNTQESSRHVAGAAVDIRIRGVPNRVLRDYARTLDRVGVGFYPNGRFVHIDVRSRSAYWVDRSGVGENPDYVPRAERAQVD